MKLVMFQTNYLETSMAGWIRSQNPLKLSQVIKADSFGNDYMMGLRSTYFTLQDLLLRRGIVSLEVLDQKDVDSMVKFNLDW